MKNQAEKGSGRAMSSNGCRKLDFETLEALGEAKLALEGLRDLLEVCACSVNEVSDTALYALLVLADNALEKLDGVACGADASRRVAQGGAFR